MKIPPKVNLQPVDDEAIVASAADYAKSVVAYGMGEYTPTAADVPTTGAPFAIDLLIPEGIETGDSREFEYGALDSRDFPLPLYWQIMTDEGHKGSVIVGRIDYAERIGDVEAAQEAVFALEDPTVTEIVDAAEESQEKSAPTRGWGNAVGVFDNGVFGREAERLVRNGMLRGVSADLDKFEAAMELAADDEEEQDGVIKNEKMNVRHARLMGATLLGKPAFQQCSIRITDDEPELEEIPLEDGMYEGEITDEELLDAGLVASAAPVVPPREWLKNPGLTKLTPLTVTDEGKVFGHLASWQQSHIGYGGRSVKPPRSRSNYAYFRTGVLRTDDGADVPVGQLTLAGGHADVTLSAKDAKEHYDETRSAIADVAVGEDAFGIWFSGALRPDVTAAQVRAFRASALSGDWRPINGALEMVATCAVNVPGFPTPRAMVAGGQVMALVAAGSQPLLDLKKNELSVVEERLSSLEQIEFEKQKAAALEALSPLQEEYTESLTASVQSAQEVLSALAAEHNAELAARAEAARKIILGE